MNGCGKLENAGSQPHSRFNRSQSAATRERKARHDGRRSGGRRRVLFTEHTKPPPGARGETRDSSLNGWIRAARGRMEPMTCVPRSRQRTSEVGSNFPGKGSSSPASAGGRHREQVNQTSFHDRRRFCRRRSSKNLESAKNRPREDASERIARSWCPRKRNHPLSPRSANSRGPKRGVHTRTRCPIASLVTRTGGT